MEDPYVALLIGNLIMTFPAIIYSIWKETRFVNRTPGLLYGLASIGSGILLFADLGYTELGFWALGIFLVLGIIFLIAWKKFTRWGKKNISLPFSHKTIGGFQIAFFIQLYITPTYENALPRIFDSLSSAQNVVLWGAIITGTLYFITGVVKKYKNRKIRF